MNHVAHFVGNMMQLAPYSSDLDGVESSVFQKAVQKKLVALQTQEAKCYANQTPSLQYHFDVFKGYPFANLCSP
jgi:hypothetical protein